MRMVRVLNSFGPFMRGQICKVFREDKYGIFLKGKALRRMDWKEEVVFGPFMAHEVEEYVPPPPARSLEEKVKEIWP